MKRWLIPLSILVAMSAAVASPAQVQEVVEAERKEDNAHSYSFVGGVLMGFIGNDTYPANRVSEKHIFLDVDGKERKVKMNSPIGLGLRHYLSDKLVQVTEFDVSFSNQSAAQAELRLLSELAYSQSASDTEITDVRDFHGGSQPNAELLYQEEGYRDRIENQIDEGRMFEDSIADTVNTHFTLNPITDLSDAYVVIGVSFDLPKATSSGKQRGSRMAVHYLGNLKAGVPKDFEIRKRFSPFYPRKTRYDLFLFDGNATPVAHTFSKGLRHLTRKEAEELKKKLREP